MVRVIFDNSSFLGLLMNQADRLTLIVQANEFCLLNVSQLTAKHVGLTTP